MLAPADGSLFTEIVSRTTAATKGTIRTTGLRRGVGWLMKLAAFLLLLSFLL